MKSDLKSILQTCYAATNRLETLNDLLRRHKLRAEYNGMIRKLDAEVEYIRLCLNSIKNGRKNTGLLLECNFHYAYFMNKPFIISINRLSMLNPLNALQKQSLAKDIAKAIGDGLRYVDVQVWYDGIYFVTIKKNALCRQQ